MRSKRIYIVSWLYHADLLSVLVKFVNPNMRVIWNVRTAEFGENYFRFSKIILYILKISSYFIPEKVLYNSRRGMFSHQAFGYCRSKGALVSNIFQPPVGNNLQSQNKLNLRPLRLGFIGRFANQKGIDILISVFNDLLDIMPNLELHIAGIDVSEIKEFSNKKKLIIYGKIEEVSLFYNNIDILVLPSRYGEGTPNVLLEALSFGLPCVSTDVGDIREILENDRGVVVQPNNPTELYHALEELLQNKDMFAEQLKVERRTFVLNNYSAVHSISKYKRQAFD
jgi:glycosyltransferase involved in cell wall biosynthesis